METCHTFKAVALNGSSNTSSIQTINSQDFTPQWSTNKPKCVNYLGKTSVSQSMNPVFSMQTSSPMPVEKHERHEYPCIRPFALSKFLRNIPIVCTKKRPVSKYLSQNGRIPRAKTQQQACTLLGNTFHVGITFTLSILENPVFLRALN